MTPQGLPRERRLRSTADFDRVYAERRRASDGRLLLFVRRNDLPVPRLGVSVSRKHGGAVQRQRLKRLLREAFRLEQAGLPAGCDFVLIPQPGAAAATLDEFRASLVRLSRKLAARAGDASGGTPRDSTSPPRSPHADRGG